jgi:hypothetical protein
MRFSTVSILGLSGRNRATSRAYDLGDGFAVEKVFANAGSILLNQMFARSLAIHFPPA